MTKNEETKTPEGLAGKLGELQKDKTSGDLADLTHELQLKKAEERADARAAREETDAKRNRAIEALNYYETKVMEKFYRDQVARRIHGYKTVEDLFNRLPKSHMEVAHTFASPLQDVVRIIRNSSTKFQVWRWNGTVFESGDDTAVFGIMMDAIGTAHGDAVTEWLSKIEEWLDGLKSEYKSKLDAARKDIDAEELEVDPSWSAEELEKRTELLEKHKKAAKAAVAGAIWQETLGDKGAEKIQAQIKGHNVGASNAEYSNFRGGVEKYLLSKLSVPEDTFDSNRYLVFDNGVLDVEETLKSKGKKFVFTEGHSPSLPVTERHRVNCDFVDYSSGYDAGDLRTIGAPALEAYLGSTGYRDDMETLFTAVGSGLFSGEILRCLPFLYGASGSGKGLFVRVLKHILPGPVAFGGRPVFSVGTTESNRFAAAKVISHPVIINDEMGKVDLDQEKMKDWSGGGTVLVEHKGRDPFEVAYRGVILTVLNTETPFNPAPDLEDQGGRTRYLPIYYPHSHSKSTDSGKYVEPEFPDTEERLKGVEASALVFYLLQRCIAHMETGEDTIPRTEHQNELLSANRSGNDPVRGTLTYGVERGSWQAVPTGVDRKKKDLLPFSTFWDVYVKFLPSAYGTEPKKKQQLLSEMTDAGLITKYNDQNRIEGYVKAGTYSTALADIDPSDIQEPWTVTA